MLAIRLIRICLGLVLLAAALMPLSWPAPTYAAGGFTVNSNQDLPDKAPGNGKCEADVYRQAGVCTLRAAIMEANALADGALFHSITLPAGDYALSRVGKDDTGFNGDLDIASNLAISGASASSTIVEFDAKAVIKDRLVHVLNGAQVTISSITIRNGAADASGGGISNFGTLTLANSIVSGNEA